MIWAWRLERVRRWFDGTRLQGLKPRPSEFVIHGTFFRDPREKFE
jgi:hypothetical protein